MKSFDSRLLYIIHIAFVQFSPVFRELHTWRQAILIIASSKVAPKVALAIESTIAVSSTGACLLVQLIQVYRTILLGNEQDMPEVRQHSSSDTVVTRSSIGISRHAVAVEEPLSHSNILFARVSVYCFSGNDKLSTALRTQRVAPSKFQSLALSTLEIFVSAKQDGEGLGHSGVRDRSRTPGLQYRVDGVFETALWWAKVLRACACIPIASEVVIAGDCDCRRDVQSGQGGSIVVQGVVIVPLESAAMNKYCASLRDRVVVVDQEGEVSDGLVASVGCHAKVFDGRI